MKVSVIIAHPHPGSFNQARLFKDRPWLNDLMKTAPDDARVAIFRIAHGEAYFWTMENNMREHEAPRLKF